jgi:flagellar hook assembly protein FlgD
MMQAETLNQLISLNTALRDLQMLNQTSYAAALVGRTVTGVAEGGTVTGVVRGVKMDTGGPMLELDNGRSLRLLDLTAVEGA